MENEKTRILSENTAWPPEVASKGEEVTEEAERTERFNHGETETTEEDFGFFPGKDKR